MDQLASTLTAVLTITTVIGLAFSGLQVGNAKNLRDANKDLRDARDDLEKERDRLKALSAQQASDLVALGRVITAEAHLTALGDRLDEHHEEAKHYWQADAHISQEILDALRRLSAGGPQ